MLRSSDRILTTHVGSLTRPVEIIDAMRARVDQAPYDPESFAKSLRQGVSEVVRRQAELGIDIVSDGEYGKSGFAAYINERLGGFERRIGTGGSPAYHAARIAGTLPFYREYDQLTQSHCPGVRSGCARGRSLTIRRWSDEYANFKRPCLGQRCRASMAVAAPLPFDGSPERILPSQEAYLTHVDALKQEYKAIVDAGFLVQLDDPWVTARWDQLLAQRRSERILKFCPARIEATNYALADIPRDRIRYHICWGSWHGPHSTDIPSKLSNRYCLRSRPPPICSKLPTCVMNMNGQCGRASITEGSALIPGVVTHATNLIEHPAGGATHRAVGETGRAWLCPRGHRLWIFSGSIQRQGPSIDPVGQT